MQIFRVLWAYALCVFPVVGLGQQISAPEPQVASIVGTVVDVQNNPIPGAAVTADSVSSTEHFTAQSNENGFFILQNLHPATAYHVAVMANNFGKWTSPEINLKPGQQIDLGGIALKISVVETTVAAVTTEQLATEQVQVAEKQRVLGVIPNFYVVYDPNPAPLTTKLKFQLALKADTDIVTFAGTAFLAGINQAADTPDYQQGAKGYGQRFGAAYTDGFTDIMIGGAILPSLLHQDPRYFYQGTGTTKSRVLHAISAPFWCRNDNGRWGFNYSSVGGDLASGALSNLYYPSSNRGAGLVFATAGTTTAGRIVNAVVQEFILRKLTPSAKDKN